MGDPQAAKKNAQRKGTGAAATKRSTTSRSTK